MKRHDTNQRLTINRFRWHSLKYTHEKNLSHKRLNGIYSSSELLCPGIMFSRVNSCVSDSFVTRNYLLLLCSNSYLGVKMVEIFIQIPRILNLSRNLGLFMVRIRTTMKCKLEDFVEASLKHKFLKNKRI